MDKSVTNSAINTIDTRHIIETYLGEHWFDGLCNPDNECGCFIGDLTQCESCSMECIPGVSVHISGCGAT